MKKILTLVGACLFLLFSIQVLAQVHPPKAKLTIKKFNHAPIPGRNVSQSFTSSTNSCTVDTISLTSQAQIDNFVSTHPACTTPKYLLIDGTGATPAITNLVGLGGITQVINKLQISNTSILNLVDLGNLTSIGDTLQLDHNHNMTALELGNLHYIGAFILIDLPLLSDIDGFSDHLHTVHGDIHVDSTNLANFGGLASIDTIYGGFSIQRSPVTTFAGMTSLVSIRDYFHLDSDTLLTSIGLQVHGTAGFLFANLPRLTSIAGLADHMTDPHIGTFWMISTGLTSLSGLDSLKTAANFYIWSNNDLTTLHGLEGLTSIDGGISISNDPSLTDLSGMGNITEIPNGTLEVSSTPFTDLTGLNNLVNIGRGFFLTYNYNMTSMNGLNNNLIIHNNADYYSGIYDSVRIYTNYQLATCTSLPLCNYLAVDGRADIFDNAPGCNSINEAAAACNVIIGNPCNGINDEKTWNGSVSDDWDEPNNWTPVGVPGQCTKVTIPDVNNLSNSPYVYNNAISIGGLIMENNADIDMNNYNLSITGTFNLHNGSIYNGNITTASKVYQPHIEDSYISGDFKLLNFGGKTDIYFNTFDGNTLFSDSVGRTEVVQAFVNNYNHDLTVVNNSDYGQFYIANASPGPDNVSGNLTMTNNSLNSTISLGLGGSEPIYLFGDLNVNGSVAMNNVTFSGFNSHFLRRTGDTVNTFSGLYMRSYGYLFYDKDIRIQNHFLLGGFCGAVSPQNPSLVFTMENGSALYQDVNGGMVAGKFKKIGNTDFTFPIGKIEQNTFWKSAITISAPASPTDEFTAEYFHHDPSLDGYDTSHYAAGFGGISGKEYWKLDNSGSGKVKVKLLYDSFKSGVSYLYQYMQVANWQNTLWKSLGSGGFAGQIYGGTLLSGDSVSSGPLTFSFKPVRKPVYSMTGPAVDTIHCVDNGFYVSYISDTAFVAGNNIKIEISDTLGVFSPTFNYGTGSKYTTATADSIYFLLYGLKPYKPYKIRLVATLPPDTSTNTKTVILLPNPNGLYNIIGPTEACQDVVSKYYPDVHQPGLTYTWKFPSGGATYTTVGDTAFVTWNTQGFRYIISTSTGACAFYDKYLSVHTNAPAPTGTPVVNNAGRWLYTSGLPSGAVYKWYRTGVLIAGATNSSYYANLAGDYTVKFSNFCGTTTASNTVSFGANSIAQTISFGGISNKIFGDAPFTPTATSTSGLPVAFTIVSGPATVNAQTNQITIIGTGLVTVRADQSGSNVYDTAASVIQMFTVNKANQTINFTSIGAQTYGATVTLTATASSGLPIIYSVFSGPATVSGNVLTITGIGNITVRASQPGDANYFAATPSDVIFCSSVTSLNPIAGFNNLCPGTATYSVNNITGATYNWRIVGGATLASTTSSTNITWTTPGTYTVLVSAIGNCGLASITDTLVVNVINSIQPDSVQSMYPTNGAINQQLPLTLSWVPAHPEAFYTFDVYLWKAEDPQPTTPYASNIPTVNYTIPLNAGLTYNHTYKWMVVSHNGSCTIIHTGPIQLFTLIPLPDLVVSNVQIPSSAFSGQTISINWTVTNPGPGKTTTNQSWTDAVFLSFDTIPNFLVPPTFNPGVWSILDFPIKPLLVGTKPNVTALDSGQHYTNSINFTLPVNYSQPLYAYVITNYPAGANAPVQVTVANDTARAPQPINVILSPTPDLRVDTVVTPSTTFSGSTINLSYKVKNYGVLTPAGTSWSDRFYISQSPIFNINTATALKAPKFNGTYYAGAQDAVTGNSVQLQADSSYTKNVELVIPNYTFGTFYIYVVTNSGNNLYEGALSNNNTNRSQLQVFLTPTPHLTVNTLDVPVTFASITQQIGVNWNISNTGFNDNIEKNKGHYYVQNGTCLIPPPPCYIPPGCNNCICPPAYPTPGISIYDSTSFGGSYWLDKVYLSSDPNVLNVNTARLLSQVTQGVENSGLNVPDNFNMTYPCQPLGTNPSNYNVNTFNVIRSGSNHPKSTNFVVPADLAEGNYYVYVLTNATKTVYEYPGTVETKRSALPISIVRPDLTVSNVTAPSTAIGGVPLTITYSVLNNGQGAVFNGSRRDLIYVSSSPTFNGTAQLIGNLFYTENLPVGTPVSHSLSYTFPPATSGTRYFYVQTNPDSSFRETNMNNNVSAGTPIAVSTALPNDLVVSSITLADTVRTNNNSTYFKYTVLNNGAGHTAGYWTDSIYMSCSPTFNYATASFIATTSHSEFVAGGSSYSDSFNLTLPFSFDVNSCFPRTTINTAYFFVKTNADNIVYEGSNGNNNLTGTGARVLVNPIADLIVTTVTGADSAFVGRQYTANFTVKNIGLVPNINYYNGSYDAIFFSLDSVFNSNAQLAGYFYNYLPLASNQTYSDSRTVTTPNIPTGDYYVFVRTNNYNSIYYEIVQNNNDNLIRNGVGAAKKIHVVQPLLPDLTDSLISVPSLVAIGQPLTLVHRVTNKGVGVTFPSNWSDDVWLSADFIPGNANDILLSSKTHASALQPAQFYEDLISTPIALNVVPGNYVLIVRTNANNSIFESNNTNNLAFRYVTIYSPAPSDLVVDQIMKPDSVFLGYTMDTAKWVIRNTSVNAAKGFTSDGIYLSKGNVLDSTAILLGIKAKQIDMPPLSKDTVSFAPLVNNVIEGNYNVIVKTDLLNNIVETNKDNNVGVATSQIYVGVKELPLNVLTSNTLTPLGRFYKLIIPDSLNGATIQVVLKSNDSLLVKNQMFIGKGYIPSAANFDYTYSTPNYGNQDIVMTSVTPGVYYIAIRCVTANIVSQNITIKAVKLPFAVLSVQSTSGGNTGNVTIKINGSLYVNGMSAKLSKSGTTIYASAIYFVNSTSVFATFNLQGQPLGIYNVTLIKPDTSMATLTSGFSIVNANNGGLITGGGINTGAGNGNAPGCDPGAASGLNSQLIAEMVIPDQVLGGWVFVIQVNYSNPTNVDIPAQSRTLYSERDIKMAFTPEGVAGNNGATSLYMELTEQNGPPGIIRAGGSGTILIYTKAPVSIPGHTKVYFNLK